MTTDEMSAAVRLAANQAAAALENSEKTRLDLTKLRRDFDRFITRLPAELQELGVLLLTREQMDYLLGQIGVAMAERVIAQSRGRSERWWDRRWSRWGIYIAAFGVAADLGLNILHDLGVTR